MSSRRRSLFQHAMAMTAGALLALAAKRMYDRFISGGGAEQLPYIYDIIRFKRGRGKVAEEEKPSAAGDVPENAPHDCPGVQSLDAGKASACEGCPNQSVCASGGGTNTLMEEEIAAVARKLKDVKHKVLVLSGKGGVGKSTVATQMAWFLRRKGYSVGLLDADICGPSVPRMTGTVNKEVRAFGEGWLPVYIDENFAVMSIGYLLPVHDGAVIWRGPKKNGLIKQFLTDVHWGPLDFLIIDTPPGTSDEHLSIVTYLRDAEVDGAILVTTPQEVALQDVRKEINFCFETHTKVLGVIENMSGSTFASLNPNGVVEMCEKMSVPYAGKIDMNSAILEAGEKGFGVKQGEESEQQIQDALLNCLNGCSSDI